MSSYLKVTSDPEAWARLVREEYADGQRALALLQNAEQNADLGVVPALMVEGEGQTTASFFRALLRTDIDLVALVVRDEETAELVIRAASAGVRVVALVPEGVLATASDRA